MTKMRVNSRQKHWILWFLFVALVSPCLAVETRAATDDSMLLESVNLLKQGKSAQAIELQRQAISIDPTNWLAHSALSYSLWRQGNIFEAINEGETAVKLNPESPVSLINLALIKQNTGNYSEAVFLYQQAAKVASQNWVPHLGISRCYILGGDQINGLRELRAMSNRPNGSFDWYYMTAKTCLEIDELSLAEKSAHKAIQAARREEQKSAAENLYLLALLRANKFEKAKPLQESVFHHSQPKDPEFYVRTALALLPAERPALGKELLNSAINNLSTMQDAEALLKLGRVFQGKAKEACRMSWLDNAQAAYAQAIALNPKSADGHLALAGLFCDKGLLTRTSDELRESMALDRVDLLAPFLLSKISKVEAPDREHLVPLNLSLVRFNIEGLTCACKLSKIHGALRKFQGVVFISTPPKKPFAGLMLVDQSAMPVRQVLDKSSVIASAPAPGSNEPGIKVSLQMLSEEPITNIDAALRVAQDVRFAPILSFQKTFAQQFNRFKEIAPITPIDEASTTSGTRVVSGWTVVL